MKTYTKVNKIITIPLTVEEEKWAKEETKKGDNAFGIQTFGSWNNDDRWTGKIGEKAVARYFLDLIPPSAVEDQQFDFIYKGKKLEIKTHGERKLTEEEYEIGIDCHLLLIRQYQFKKTEADVYVFCFYEIYPKRLLHILGWISKKDIQEKGILCKRKETIYSPGYERKLAPDDDNVLINHGDINDMELL